MTLGCGGIPDGMLEGWDGVFCVSRNTDARETGRTKWFEMGRTQWYTPVVTWRNGGWGGNSGMKWTTPVYVLCVYVKRFFPFFRVSFSLEEVPEILRGPI